MVFVPHFFPSSPTSESHKNVKWGENASFDLSKQKRKYCYYKADVLM